MSYSQAGEQQQGLQLADCAQTPSLQWSDDKATWTTKIRLECEAACPNNATGSEPEKGWTVAPGPGTVAPPGTPPGLAHGIGAVVDAMDDGNNANAEVIEIDGVQVTLPPSPNAA